MRTVEYMVYALRSCDIGGPQMLPCRSAPVY